MLVANAPSQSKENLKFSLTKPMFTGYAAIPLAGLVVRLDEPKTIRYLRKLSLEEGIPIYLQKPKDVIDLTVLKKIPRQRINRRREFDKQAWLQDYGMFRRDSNGRTILEIPTEHTFQVENMASNFDCTVESTNLFYEGGNRFFGWKEDGTPYLIIGQKEIEFITNHANIPLQQVPKELANRYNIPLENICVLPQPEYHLSMMVRPLTGNTVLLQDFDLTNQMLSDLQEQTTRTQALEDDVALERWRTSYSAAQVKTKLYQEWLQREDGNSYTSVEGVKRRLESKGFHVISVPGVVYKNREFTPSERPSANFLNATVHVKPNGRILYITNDSGDELLNRYFENFLRSKVDNIDSVKFVPLPDNMLAKAAGGVQCITLEIPNFDAINQKKLFTEKAALKFGKHSWVG